MRHSQLKKIRFRHMMFMQLRKLDKKDGNIKTIIDSNGHEIALNLNKHLLFNRPYKNLEYQRILLRSINKLEEPKG